MKKILVLSVIFLVLCGCVFKSEDGSGSVEKVKESVLPVRPTLSQICLSMDKFYIDEQELAAIKEDDRKFAFNIGEKKNRLVSFKTSIGEFKVVSCFGRQSLDPESFGFSNSPLPVLRCDMMQLPNGHWIQAFPGPFHIRRTLETEKGVYLLCDKDIFKVVTPEEMIVVISLGTRPHIDYQPDGAGQIVENYWQVFKSDSSDFGGFLEFSDDWKLHVYEGGAKTGIKEIQNKEEECLKLTLISQQKIIFDKRKGVFVDL